MTVKTSLGLVALGAMLVACGSDPIPNPKVTPDATATAPTPNVVTNKKPEGPPPTSGSINIDDKILKACGDLPTAHFAFDSADIKPQAGAALDALARCFSTGPLKGRKMRLIGHTDPRGENDYNLKLGQERAGSVSNYLSKKAGLDTKQVEASSKGAMEATGTDEESWARDRKVEIFLVE